MAVKKDDIKKTYRGSEAKATAELNKELEKMKGDGFYVASKVYKSGAYGADAYLVAFALCVALIGFFLLLFMLFVKPSGRLLVTFKYNENPHIKSIVTSDYTKVCPNCAEKVNCEAKVCHFCNHSFVAV